MAAIMWAAQTQVPEKRTTQSMRSSSFIFLSAARASSLRGTTIVVLDQIDALIGQGLLRAGDELRRR